MDGSSIMNKASLATVMLALALSAAPVRAAKTQDALARGAYLVNGIGCADCHTPLKMGPRGPEPDLSRGLSGHPQGAALPRSPEAREPWVWGGAGTNTAFWGPWGVSYAANLTPDAATGLGAWTSDQFVRAMKTGKHVGVSRPIAPPMPWRAFGQLTEADLRAIFAYLRAQPAVVNAVPPYEPPR
jgi:mono/diheme cytochrome c family protein